MSEKETPDRPAVPGRREFLAGGLLSIPLIQVLAGEAQADGEGERIVDGDGERIVVFLPGFMGSTLSGNGVPIWSSEAGETYNTLLNNAELLRYTGNAADAPEVLHALEIWKFSGFTGTKEVYGPLLNRLSALEFDRVLAFPYDWRLDMGEILDGLRDRLKAELGLSYLDGQAQRSGHHIYLIGHSMGGVLSLLAAGRKLIHPDDLRQLILIAPPLAGATQAFRSTFDATSVPFIKEMYGVWWRKNARMAWDNLHSVIRSFPATYQLMPPDFLKYIHTDGWKNPFTEDVLPNNMVQAARAIHKEIAKAITSLPIPRSRTHVIVGTSLLTDSSCHVTATRAATGERTYEFSGSGMNQVRQGDGTVLNSSNVYRRSGVDALGERGHVRRYPAAGHSELCTDERVLDLLQTLL